MVYKNKSWLEENDGQRPSTFLITSFSVEQRYKNQSCWEEDEKVRRQNRPSHQYLAATLTQ